MPSFFGVQTGALLMNRSLTEIDAISFNKDLRDTYRRYLYTANIISDQELKLQDKFLEKLQQKNTIFNGPFVHCTPSYRLSNTIRDLVNSKGPIKLSSKFLSLPSRYFAPDQPLYSHQIEAINTIKSKRNLVVATGTGSGKTECFLIPILDSIMKDTSGGIRAIIVYPMNALADDQLRRLRELLSETPDVTFGRYTGDTEEDGNEEPHLPNERLTRKELRNSPPHLLLTNFAMLEYLLLRPRDSALFKNHKLQFIVLDEAHAYTGAQGIEIAMLMRRLQQYLKRTSDQLQFILTSATLGDSENATTGVAKFAENITGAAFSTKEVLRGDIINSFSDALEESLPIELLRSDAFYGENFQKWSMALEDPVMLCELLRDVGLEAGEIAGRDVSRILYDLLSKNKMLAVIHDRCRQLPTSLEDICGVLNISIDDKTISGIRWLITMGAFARSSPDAVPLLPTRLHFFARGLSGATICLNPECAGKADHLETKWSEFYLEDRNICGSCSNKVLPLQTCVHCGLPVIRVYVEDGKWKTSCPPNLSLQTRLLIWSNDTEDQSEEDVEQTVATLCLSCSSFTDGVNEGACCEKPSKIQLMVIRERISSDGNLEVCPRCSGTKGMFRSVLRDFRTTEDAPTVVLSETIIRNLPFDPNDSTKNSLPANGRNLLVFSDSRQRAAFFAPYLEYTAAESAYLGPLLSALIKAESNADRPVTFREVATQYVRNLSDMPIAVICKRDESGEEYYDLKPGRRLLAPDRDDVKKEVETLLFRDFCKSTKHKRTLQGLGLASIFVEFTEYEKDQLQTFMVDYCESNTSKAWQIVQALVDVLIQRKAIAFPDYVLMQNIVSPGPKAVTVHFSQSRSIDGRQVFRWNPYNAPDKSKKNAINKSRQLTLIARALGLEKNQDSVKLDKILTLLWDIFKEGLLSEAEQWPGEYRIDPDRLQLTTSSQWYMCNVCGRITTLGSLGFCVSASCPGIPQSLSSEDMERKFSSNHYRQRYFLPAMPLKVKEHTAQLTIECGKRYQEEFRKGQINVLSSSTTFEMGVDVGQLKAVLLRNVPPTTSSYIQRAGRAGRRRDGVSVAVTFARNIPHDQYHFQRPEGIIIGNILSPSINIGNRPLAQRHCNSLLLGYFLREVEGIDEKTLNRTTVEDFFVQQFAGKTLAIMFVKWISNDKNRKRMSEHLRAILPSETLLTAEEVMKQSVEMLYSSPSSVNKYQVIARLERFDDQMKDIESQITTATVKARVGLARASQSLARLRDQFLKQRLIDFLSSAGWLPGYAFPQDIVKLLVRQPDYTDRMRLQRDREYGISEYAPGSEIIADGVLFRSGGVWFNSNEPEIRRYTRCPECRNISTCLETEVPSSSCSRCGTRLTGAYLPRYYLKPEGFTTLLSDPVKRPSLNRAKPPRSSEVFLLEGVENFENHKIQGISYGIKRGGKLFRANSGYKFNGFFICRKCGLGLEKATSGLRHTTPWETQCNGTFIKVDLAHEIVTDILQLRFQGCRPPAPDLTDRSFWLSLQSAFLNGACDALGISSSDLDGTFHGWTEDSWIGELVIYDRVPGGAGHIERIIDELDKVLRTTLSRVRDCKCPDIKASCYACLRNYNNQFSWNELSREKVIDWLTKILPQS